MELVVAKTVLLGAGGFFFGGGFALFKALDDWRRTGALPSVEALPPRPPPAPPAPAPATRAAWLRAALFDAPPPPPPARAWQRAFAVRAPALALAVAEGARTGRVLALGTAVAGGVGLWRHGAQRYDLVLDVRRDATGAAVGVAAGTYAALAHGPPRAARAGAAAAAALAFYGAARLAAWGGDA
jgi:hypothetical protein